MFKAHFLQDPPDFLVESDGHSVQRSVQTPPAQPLAVPGILDNRYAFRNVQGFNGGQPVPLIRDTTTSKKLFKDLIDYCGSPLPVFERTNPQ